MTRLFGFSEFQLRWQTPPRLQKHCQPDRNVHIQLTSRATSRTFLTLTPTSKHPWVTTAFGLRYDIKPWKNRLITCRNSVNFRLKRITLVSVNKDLLSCVLRMKPWHKSVCCVISSLHSDIPRACVRLPGGEREGGESEERRRASAHSLHGEDRRDSEPLQRWHHCLPTWVTHLHQWCVRICWHDF